MFKIERVGKVARDASESPAGRPTGPPDPAAEGTGGEGSLRNLRVVVEAVRGKCTSGMRPGDTFSLRSGRLYIPAQRHFCLYALHAVLPLLPAKQRALADDDWLKDDAHVICPDPTGNVIMRIEECQ
ncbi:MAG: TIGR04076 family protein [Chloroflexi bacterium]|nr:TIGR04076 family protein [Chloroflexota bacterium]